MEKKFISELKINEKVDSCFILRKKNLKRTKYDKPYLEMTLADKSGVIESRMWDDAEKFNEKAETGDIVLVKGTVDKYREEKQLKVDLIEKADDRAFRYEDMVRIADNGEKIRDDIGGYIESIKNPWVRKLADSFTGDEALMAKFARGVGGKSWHNAYIGGLMEHTFEVMAIVDKMCSLYPEADRDVAIFGAFMHDIGKIHEIDEKKLEYTVEGGLVGHIAIGYRMLNEKIYGITGFPEELSLRLGHIVLSHHGEYEQQSPVLPKTLEATIIYQTDELVSQANAVKEIQLLQSGEGKVWSPYVALKSRKYFIRDRGEEGWGEADSADAES
ncbi:MAG: HD domain-containing protein [Candidatus Omnitrophica bacterium]|nr:HD domain-containing protein [Candidatus Omnitrophota bacterium]